MPAISKTGYVQSYKLELHGDPLRAGQKVFFSVTITDDQAGQQAPETFIFERNISSNVVDRSLTGDTVWAVSYGNVQQAMIATIKDALLNRKRVVVHAFQGPETPMDFGGPMVNRVVAVEIQA